MTSESKPSDAVQNYLTKAFSLNPMWESEQLLELRRKTLRIDKAIQPIAGPSAVEMQQRRDAMRRTLKTVQHEFWKLPLDQLQRRIAAVDVKLVPELSGVVKRLRTAAMCRGEFPKLASTAGMHLPLFHAFKTAVVLPPAEAGYVREQYLQSIGDRTELQQVRKSIAIIQRDYPILYALEKDWFQTLSGLKKPRRQRAEPETQWRNDFDSGSYEWLTSWPMWILASIFIRVMLRMIAGAE